jgi:triacylglycerol lipase
MLMRRPKQLMTAVVILLALGCWWPQFAHADNTYPVVFVHGFAGFGRSEGLGFRYWGGKTDLEEVLKASHPDQKFFTAAVGPVSSNWDRAVELFHQVKGGCVDYGKQHSDALHHHRFGRCYEGFYPEWGKDHPIHIVSHSMGGQTARTLAQLLAANGDEKNSGLFGDNPVDSSWIMSITTLAAPHDGTTLADIITDYVPFIQSIVAGMATLASGLDGVDRFVYDFKLDQWGIKAQAATESFPEYLLRVLGSPLWTERRNRDLSSYDLSPKGAAELNAWVKDQPLIYYFSYSTKTTWTGMLTGFEYPLPLTNPLISIFAGPPFMGSFTRKVAGYLIIDKSWWPNDGVVNTRSMRGPTLQLCNGKFCQTPSTITDIREGGRPTVGVWNWKGLEDGLDHMDIIGWSLQFDSARFYQGLIETLRRITRPEPNDHDPASHDNQATNNPIAIKTGVARVITTFKAMKGTRRFTSSAWCKAPRNAQAAIQKVSNPRRLVLGRHPRVTPRTRLT